MYENVCANYRHEQSPGLWRDKVIQSEQNTIWFILADALPIIEQEALFTSSWHSKYIWCDVLFPDN